MTYITRIIAKLDTKGPNTIKGIQMDGYRKLGLAEQFARLYYLEGIDEIIIQDSVASLYRRESLLEIIKHIAKDVFIPITVAGGIRNLKDIENLLNAGADKVAMNTAAVDNPNLLKEAALTFGSQNITSSIEVFQTDQGYEVWTHYGRERTSLNFYEWLQMVQELGAGEILLTSIRNDGMGTGYDLNLLEAIKSMVRVPLMICGGANDLDNAKRTIELGADALVVASKFHYHYVQSDAEYLSNAKSYDMRVGEAIDTGNLDFIIEGYGGKKDLFVEPCSIKDFKTALMDRNIEIRSFSA